MKIYELVNNNYDKLTQNDLQIVEYISNNYQKSQDINCEKLADLCHVSRTTLLRFCHKLGLKSFAELKYLLKQSNYNKEENSSIDLDEICKSYHEIIDEVKDRNYDEVCELIYNSEVIYIYGTGNAQKAESEEFKRIFLATGKCVIDLFDLGEVQMMKNKFTSKDSFVIISLSGETKEGIEILKIIESTEINTISITRFENNTIARMCKSNLYVSTKILKGFKDFSYEMTAAFYVLLDMLFVYYLEYKKGVQV